MTDKLKSNRLIFINSGISVFIVALGCLFHSMMNSESSMLIFHWAIVLSSAFSFSFDAYRMWATKIEIDGICLWDRWVYSKINWNQISSIEIGNKWLEIHTIDKKNISKRWNINIGLFKDPQMTLHFLQKQIDSQRNKS